MAQTLQTRSQRSRGEADFPGEPLHECNVLSGTIETVVYPEEVPAASVADLPAEGFVLLDVRENDEWRVGHAPQAVHIPLGDLPARLDDLAEHVDDQTVYVVCRTGGRSAQATAYLNTAGYEAVNIAGGMKSWHTEGRPMVADDPAAEPGVL